MIPDPAIQCRNLELRREGKTVLSLDHWKVAAGERWVVMGPNGCGKSSLALALSGRLFPWEGDLVTLGLKAGQDSLLPLRHRIGYSGDALEGLIDPPTTCLDLVCAAFSGDLVPRFHRPTRAQRERARDELSLWGLADFLHQPLLRISLGQRKRAWLARALATRPDLLVLDEPCAGLDPRAREDLVARLDLLASRRPELPIVLVTHHLEEIPSSFDRLLLLDQGQLLSQGPLGPGLRTGIPRAFGEGFRASSQGGRWRLSVVGPGTKKTR